MRIISNTGDDRVVDELRKVLGRQSTLDVASPDLSLFAFGELRALLGQLLACRLVLPTSAAMPLDMLGGVNDRRFRNRLEVRWLARSCAEWIERCCEVRGARARLPQSTMIVGHPDPAQRRVLTGNCPFTTDGLGLTPGDQFGLIQSAEKPEELSALGSWFGTIWSRLHGTDDRKAQLLAQLGELASHKAPSLVYGLVLYHLFSQRGEEVDEERVVKSATGIHDSSVWKKLYRFQRDGVVGAIDKLERYGGCIIADSVGLGKTIEALAIIRYYELRNDRVLVLCPKRLRDNWTLYLANDRRNPFSADRLGYDVLNHTDLSRDDGTSGDIDLAHVNWGNYDLVVIDESHNFRNKASRRDRETRYGRLMERIIRAGVKTKVLMLSATPVNNRLADLKNQISFVTEGEDGALGAHGIPSIEATVRQAQSQFNAWLKLDEAQRSPARLLDMLGFDYFKLLDLLTIARSRKHVEKYYGTAETGTFPERLRPLNIKADVDLRSAFPPIRDINTEIRRLNLSAYAPLRYVLPHKVRDYEQKYSTTVRDGLVFKQSDREENMIHLLRVNMLKRMESSVNAFALTLRRQLDGVRELLGTLESAQPVVEDLSIGDIETEDPEIEPFLVGGKVRVLIQDVDRVRWTQDLREDANRLATLLAAAEEINSERDAKLAHLRRIVEAKCREPINAGNRKILVFTAFADTARYLYDQLAEWARADLGVNAALVTGADGNRTTAPGLRADLATILTAFSPRSNERPPELDTEGDIDLLIATDCISEGQNLQDCDFVVNYDIHWNPVRIIQRFGRVDRIGSRNERIQLVNFWPNLELEEYINLEERVTGRMVLMDLSATGEENPIRDGSAAAMNDLEYRRRQLQALQETVIDLEDLSTGISITDLTLTDFRIDLADFLRRDPEVLQRLQLGTFACATTLDAGEAGVPPGVIFCLRAEGDAASDRFGPNYPLAPHYLVHVGENGSVVLPFTQARRVLDALKRVAVGRDLPDAGACARFDRQTRSGQDMSSVQALLAAAVASIVGFSEERAVASLFSPGGTHALRGEFRGIDDFEVVAYMVVLADPRDGAPA